MPRRKETHYLQLISSGIGLETSLQFAAEGARVVLSDVNEAAVNKAAEVVRERFPTSEAIAVKCDVSKEAEIKALVDAAVAKFGRLDVMVSSCHSLADDSSTMLVSCTARTLRITLPCDTEHGPSSSCTDCSDDDAVNTEEKIWDLTQAINVKGVWWGCKYAVIAMRQVSRASASASVRACWGERDKTHTHQNSQG